MIYTVGEMAKLLNISPSTLRYYDREGLLPFVERSNSGMRIFKDKDFEALFLIEYLKKAGMSLSNIRTYINLVQRGDSTIEARLEMFETQREAVKKQLDELKKTLDVLEYKCWYYETAKKAGTTSVPREMHLENIPENIRYVKEKSRCLQQLK